MFVRRSVPSNLPIHLFSFSQHKLKHRASHASLRVVTRHIDGVSLVNLVVHFILRAFDERENDRVFLTNERLTNVIEFQSVGQIRKVRVIDRPQVAVRVVLTTDGAYFQSSRLFVVVDSVDVVVVVFPVPSINNTSTAAASVVGGGAVVQIKRRRRRSRRRRRRGRSPTVMMSGRYAASTAQASTKRG